MTPPQRVDLSAADLDEGSLSELVDAADLDALRFAGLSWPEVSLRHATLRETLLERPDVTTLHNAGGRWRDVRVSGGRIGVLEAYDSEWRAVELVGCRLAYVNLRGADVADLTLRDCHVDELDLTDAQVRRATLTGTRVGRLDVRDARLESFDLRGATYDALDGVEGLRGALLNPEQLTLAAPLLADALGILVAETDDA